MKIWIDEIEDNGTYEHHRHGKMNMFMVHLSVPGYMDMAAVERLVKERLINRPRSQVAECGNSAMHDPHYYNDGETWCPAR